VVREWRSGAKQLSAEVLHNYETLVKQQKDQILHYEQEFGKLKSEMANMEKGLIAKLGKLEGQLQEKDKQLQTLSEILANRNPELEKVLAEIRDFMKELNDTNMHQTKILEASQKRDKGIDDSTDAQTGNILRKNN